MEPTGEKPTEDFDARIIIDVTDDSFKVTHTPNLDLEQVYPLIMC